jgi:serine/threonine-protein kinase
VEPDATRPLADPETDAEAQATEGAQVGQLVGRYVVLAELGRGGEGQVYEAFDTELERKVALKLLHSGAPAARREARAQAKLQHPAVVSIFDVGDADAQAYIAMELMDPLPFAQWAAQAPALEVLQALRRVAEGVHAAHGAGLVHGDIKPSNILRGRSGEPKLSDFGVARGIADAIDTLAGTRAFMAPELLAGESGTPASDQYAFCVTAWSLFHRTAPSGAAEQTLEQQPSGGTTDASRTGEHVTERGLVWSAQSVPTFAVDALQRGMHSDPAQRWPDMAALAEALEPPASRSSSSKVGLAVVAAVAVGGGALALSSQGRPEHSPCAAAGEPMARAWDPPRRDAALARLQAPGFEQVAARTTAALDAYAQGWITQAEASCRATHVQRSQSEARLDLRSGCLQERLTAFEASVAALTEVETAREHAHQLTDALPDLSSCESPPSPRAEDALPEDHQLRDAVAKARVDLKRLETLRIVRDDERAAVLWAELLPRVEAIGHPPLSLETRLEGAHLFRARGAYEDAAASGEAALALAVRLSRPDDAREAAALLASMISYEQQDPEAAAAYGVLLASLLEDPSVPAQGRAASLDALATYEAGAADYPRAVQLAEDATALYRDEIGTDSTYYGSLLNNQALILDHAGQTQAALKLHREAIEIRRAVLGPKHPDVAQSLDNLASALLNAGQAEEALATSEQAVAVYRAVAPQHANAAVSFNTLGNAHAALGRWAESLVALDEAKAVLLETLGADHPYLALVEGGRGVVLMELERTDEALAAFERSVELESRTLGERHPQLVNSRANYGDVLVKAGRVDQGLGVLRDAHTLGVEVLGAGHVDTVYVATLLALRLYKLDRWVEARSVAEGALADSDAGSGGRPGDLKSLRSVADASERKLGHG